MTRDRSALVFALASLVSLGFFSTSPEVEKKVLAFLDRNRQRDDVTNSDILEAALREDLAPITSWDEALHAFARAQDDHFGLKEWSPGVPWKNVLGEQIVFRDSNGFRYTVSCVKPDGSHARAEVSRTRSRLLWAFAKKFSDLDRLLKELIEELKIIPGALDLKREGDWNRGDFLVLAYKYDPIPLD